MLMYAANTTLYCNIDQDVNEEVINVELAKLSEWLGANKLALNISKTKYMVFSSFFSKITIYCLSVRLSSVEIISFRDNLISNRPTDLKITLNVR